MHQELSQAAADIETHFDFVFQDIPNGEIKEAMRYAVRGGKRLRGFLVLESAKLFDISSHMAMWSACGIEAMHAYSLVHDDLPAMDDDDLRRGLPTIHVKWDEATAILAGDALQSLAFELVSHSHSQLSAERRTALVSGLAIASGAAGMVLGQALDIAAETAQTPLELDDIIKLQQGKTGALIGWSATAGAVMAGQDIGPLKEYSSAIGLAFQIADDILDVEGDPQKAGKRLQKDAFAGKATFVSLLGLKGAKDKANSLVCQACDAISIYGDRAITLQQVAKFVISRDS